MMNPEEVTYSELFEIESDPQPDLVEKLRELDEPKRELAAEREAKYRESRHFLETLDAQAD